MGTAGGPNVIEDGLVLCLDAANNKGISPAANEEFNNSDQFVKNLISRGQSITANNGVKVGNLNYFTAFAIDYPESSFGGVAAGRDGVTAGFNVTSGTKTHEYGRALHFHIWDDSAGGWISNSNFNGDGSFRYDSWSGYANASTQVAQFVTDYNNLKVIYPNDTFIVAGSHRDSTHTTDKINVLLDLGAPSNVSSLLDGSPEWILVGKPGLGAGNAYVWAFENGNTGDAIRVAHAVFPLPINKVNKDNYFEFDGSNDFIDAGSVSGDFSNFTVIAWFYPTSVSNHENVLDCNYSNYASTGNIGPRLELNSSGALKWIYSNVTNSNSSYYTHAAFANGLSANSWHCSAITFNGSNSTTYFNGTASGLSRSVAGSPTGFIGSLGDVVVGKGFHLGGSERVYTGRVAQVRIYNRALSASEVLQNYNATKGRYGL